MSKALRIVFAGTPEFAAIHLQSVLDTEHEVIAVYTQPDRPAGRGRKLTPSPVKELALQHDIPVYQPKSLRNEEAQKELADLKPDLIIVVAYGLILPKVVLDTPVHGCINVHGSILPRWRGAAPIQRAVGAGDKESGVTIMQMDEGLDTGDMLLKVTCPIDCTDTSQDLYDRLAKLGGPALVETLTMISEGTLQPEKQNEDKATYAHKMSKEEGQVDWSRPAAELDCKVRGFNPWPVAWMIQDAEQTDKRTRIWDAEALEDSTDAAPGTIIRADKSGIDVACGEGVLRLKKLQLPSSKAMDVLDLLNSRKEMFAPGTVFSYVELS
ncbi:methionyl-tRNA formyltransferase [Sansalvadorimonas verongulae]|uniref:methionyl-tRNA formyltransferase n=1 Tax=Sansalvadorimonas verongulae TaxID=2172824 RepID=UPI0012BD55A9|nr:methionyl-tRNA formyltransferase [Sansalvadorimonas verongulae]MTI14186.1 methionyl-tRNA formyltransferase [Sansalvadorimonas verongulae]